jgi:hypothetical protein
MDTRVPATARTLIYTFGLAGTFNSLGGAGAQAGDAFSPLPVITDQ